MYGLIDGNNFYASCERVFRPDLRNKPVVVLSNNDGCAIARSNEAKKLGIKMGEPYFKFKQLAKEKNVEVFSANFVLYGDLSNRIVNIAKRYCKDIEIYSIDENFLDFNGYDYFDLKNHCLELRKFVLKGVGIPTSIGIASTKTLAKIANKIAKKYPEKTEGVHIINTEELREKALKWTPLEDVWGIGRRYAVKFSDMGIKTAWEFTQLSEITVQKIMGIYGVRMHKELNGIPQYKLNEGHINKKNIATTRTFNKRIDDITELEERISTFAFKCSEKLRKQKSCCRYITIFLRTDSFKADLKQYFPSITLPLVNPSNSAFELSKIAIEGLRMIYKPYFQFKKAGVMVSEFVPENERLVSLFDKDNFEKHKPVMEVIDFLNKKYHSDKVKLSSMNLEKTWIMNQKNLSPQYTTCVSDLLKVFL